MLLRSAVRLKRLIAKNRAQLFTRLVLVFAIGALVLTIRNIGLATLGKYLRLLGWWWLAIVPMEMICTTLDATAMRAFSSPDQQKLSLRSALLAQLAGRAVNAVTPSGNLGEVVKVSVLTDFVSQSRAVATILLYNVVSFCMELLIFAAAAPFLLLLVPMPVGMKWMIGVAGAVCVIISVGLYLLVRAGMLGSVARLAVRIRHPRDRAAAGALYARWEPKLRGVDDKMRLVAGARRRDRWIGIVAITASRINSMVLSLRILHAVGQALTPGFIAAYVCGGFFIYFAASLVPMGVGVSEGGYYGFYRALGENPARGVTLVLARRTVTILYATIGLILVATSETVKRAKEGRASRVAETPATGPASGLATGLSPGLASGADNAPLPVLPLPAAVPADSRE